MILSGDWHLDSNPANEYRWAIFDVLSDRGYRGKPIAILGDITDRKDKHNADFVTRLVETLFNLSRTNDCEITVLRGNHDTALSGPSFFEFLSYIPRLRYISAPYADGPVLYLPSSTDPTTEWADIPFRNYRCILMHQTVKGSDFGNGMRAESDKMPGLPRGIRIYSGDVHVPQTIGDITYVGAPHPKNFGDTHHCRLLEIDEQSYRIVQEIKLRPMRKHMIEISSVAELDQLRLNRGDQAKVRFTMEADQSSQWLVEREAIASWATARGVALMGSEPVVTQEAPVEAAAPPLEADPALVLEAFGAAEAIDPKRLQIGRGILRQVPLNA